MAKIVFIMDIEEGHLLPSFGLAHALRARGHDVSYVSVVDNGQLVTEQGFLFYPVLEQFYPKGFRKKFKETNALALSRNGDFSGLEIPEHASVLLNGSYDSFLKDLNADLFIISFYLNLDILLLYYKLGIRPVIFSPVLREEGETIPSVCGELLSMLPLEKLSIMIDLIEENGFEVSSIPEMVAPFNLFTEVIACPREFEIQAIASPQVSYIGSSIRKPVNSENIYSLYGIPPGKKIIFSSMGTQAIRHGALCETYFGKVIHVMKDPAFKDMHLVLSVGPEYKKEGLDPLPGNVTVASWAPQLDILKVASLAIIHGGFGSVKECIYYGVPMIIFPLGYDQPSNGKRVLYHHLGVMDDIGTITENALRSYMLYLLNDEQIRSSVKKMQHIFREQEDNQAGVDAIEKLLPERKEIPVL
jgi:zeaxanthin glucosyltransferase